MLPPKENRRTLGKSTCFLRGNAVDEGKYFGIKYMRKNDMRL